MSKVISKFPDGPVETEGRFRHQCFGTYAVFVIAGQTGPKIQTYSRHQNPNKEHLAGKFGDNDWLEKGEESKFKPEVKLWVKEQ